MIIIAPRSHTGKNEAMSTAGSSALSIIRSQCFLLDSHLLTESTFATWLHSRAIFAKLCSAVAFVLASIQNMHW